MNTNHEHRLARRAFDLSRRAVASRSNGGARTDGLTFNVVLLIIFSCLPAHAQFSGNNQTNTTSHTDSTTIGDGPFFYRVGVH